MSLEFIHRSLRVASVLVVLSAAFTAVYVGPWFGAAVAAGGAWNVLNLLLITLLITSATASTESTALTAPAAPAVDGEPSPRRPAPRRRLVLLALVKFPVLYGGGYWLLARTQLPAGGFAVGFSLLLVVLLLRALGARESLFGVGGGRAGRARAAAFLLASVLPAAATAEVHGAAEHGHEAAVSDTHGQAQGEARLSADVEDSGMALARGSEHADVPIDEHEGGEHAEHGEEHAGGVPHLANFLTLARAWVRSELPDHPWLNPLDNTLNLLRPWEPILFSFFLAIVFIGIVRAGIRHRAIIPGRFQTAIELPFGFIHDMVTGVMGHEGRRYVPFAATLFLYILIMNLQGILPGMMAPTSSLNVTLGLAICTFLYVQLNAIRANGPLGYFHHLAGSPADAVGWGMVPLMLPLHVLEEFIKPVSLSLRLFGNVLGEDALIAQFAILGIMVTSFFSPSFPVGIPFQAPIMLLALLTGTIQALVFTMLSTMYIFLMLPHEEHH